MNDGGLKDGIPDVMFPVSVNFLTPFSYRAAAMPDATMTTIALRAAPKITQPFSQSINQLKQPNAAL